MGDHMTQGRQAGTWVMAGPCHSRCWHRELLTLSRCPSQSTYGLIYHQHRPHLSHCPLSLLLYSQVAKGCVLH